MAIKYGTALADNLAAGDGGVTIYGLAGDDLLVGRLLHDELDGGTGNDTLEGGFGGDRLAGGAGQDTFRISVDARRRRIPSSPSTTSPISRPILRSTTC